MANRPNRYRHSQQLSESERDRQFRRYGRTAEDAYADKIRNSHFYCPRCRRRLGNGEWDVCTKCGKPAPVDNVKNR